MKFIGILIVLILIYALYLILTLLVKRLDKLSQPTKEEKAAMLKNPVI
jgi:hypothetical protein